MEHDFFYNLQMIKMEGVLAFEFHDPKEDINWFEDFRSYVR